MKFVNYEAADRRANLIPFGLLPQNTDLSWISDNPYPPDRYTITYSSTVSIDTANGLLQVLTLTGDCLVSGILTNGGTPVDPTLLTLKIIWDSTGGWAFRLPSTVKLPDGYEFDTTAGSYTTLELLYTGSYWSFLVPPVVVK